MSWNILLSSAGRRVALLRAFRESLRDAGMSGGVSAADVSPLAAAVHVADHFVCVPHCMADDFVPMLLDACERYAVRLVVPTIDTELPVLAAHRQLFADAGVAVAVSDPETIDIGSDKQHTHDWLTANGFPTVRQAGPDTVIDSPDSWRYPVIVKPRRGSASAGVMIVHSREELSLAARNPDLVVQEIAPGDEYTIDVFVDGAGRARCAVPRRRLEVRGGEVSKGLTVRCEPLEQLACRLVETLPGAYGALNIQVFLDRNEGEPRIIEINPRFGGGYPLSYEAGADFPRWLIEDVAGLTSTITPDGWRDGLVMLRYDDAVFVDAGEVDLEGRVG